VHSHTTFDVAIIGAGLAGGATAFALARRGAQVVVIESLPQVASKSSGNLFGLITPYLATKRSPHDTLYSTGYSFTQDLLHRYPACATSLKATGALQLPSAHRLTSIVTSNEPILGAPNVQRITSAEASDLAGIAVPSNALYIRDAGFLSPRVFVEGLLAHTPPNMTLALNSECTAIERHNDQWRISLTKGETLYCSTVVICTAYEATKFTQTAWLPLEPIRGQTVCADQTEQSAKLQCVVSYGGYITPPVEQTHFVGAHYRHHDGEILPRDADTASVLDRCAQALPSLRFSSSHTHNARVCFRTSTVDRLPYVGVVPDYKSFQANAAQYRSGTTIRDKVSIQNFPSLYINAGHGSRGLLSCPIGGEIIARLITGEALGELEDVAKETNPERLPPRLIKS